MGIIIINEGDIIGFDSIPDLLSSIDKGVVELDINNITTIEVRHSMRRIISLKGIEKLINLKYLKICTSKLKDIEGLYELKNLELILIYQTKEPEKTETPNPSSINFSLIRLVHNNKDLDQIRFNGPAFYLYASRLTKDLEELSYSNVVYIKQLKKFASLIRDVNGHQNLQFQSAMNIYQNNVKKRFIKNLRDNHPLNLIKSNYTDCLKYLNSTEKNCINATFDTIEDILSKLEGGSTLSFNKELENIKSKYTIIEKLDKLDSLGKKILDEIKFGIE